jgi:hypothetical protein
MRQLVLNRDLVPELDEIATFYEQGLYLQAYRAGEHLGPLEEWPGAAGAVMAGRLAGNLGAPRLARRLFLKARREGRQNGTA